MSVNSANYAIELEICDYNADYFKYVIRVETDPTDPTGVYRQEEIIDIPEDEVTVSKEICTGCLIVKWTFFKLYSSDAYDLYSEFL